MDQDAAYKQLFSFPDMVADLLREYVPEAWVQEIDFGTLERVSGSYVSDDLRTREEDMVWRVRVRGQWVYIYVLLEFQTQVEPFMAVRIVVYVGLLYQDLIRRGEVTADRRLPPVVPIVLYSGERRWT
ncbi:MAG: Rpn family recombination-promoting nuclease/putative transposase, partial [Caldilineales bacterium]|nr:Rpn family recombination-promoting nuclease/putative transposase [Caldilineales bacterium]